MYTHPEIHSQAARQRQADFDSRFRPRGRGAQSSQASLDDLGPLVRAAQAGDPEAWELLVMHFTPKVRRVVGGYRLSSADVDDVVQETWAAAYTHVGRLRMPEAFGGWLLVTARHASFRALRRSRHEVAVDGDHLPQEVTDRTPEAALLEAEERNAVHAAIERLPERQRMIVRTLLRQPNTSYADLAGKLRIPTGSIGPTRRRALARLRRDDQLIATV